MPGPLQSGMHVSGIAAVDHRQRPAQAVLVMRHQDEMDVVGHQHPRPDLNARSRAVLAEQVAVQRVICIAEEGLRATIAALRYMVGMPWENRACQASHALAYRSAVLSSIKWTVTVIPDSLLANCPQSQ
jgi:hypothetical protein